MRTTLTIEDDVLAAAKALAAQQHLSLGEVISDLARRALKRDMAEVKTRNGVPLLPIGPDAMPVAPELVNQLRDELP